MLLETGRSVLDGSVLINDPSVWVGLVSALLWNRVNVQHEAGRTCVTVT
jgi:hypothetical protein